MDQQQLISRTLERIKQERITPEPSWKLSLHNYFFWGLFVAMLALAALSFSMMFHLTWDMDWEIFEYVKKSRIIFLFNILPFFWLVALLLFAIFSYYNIRHTKRGYRYRTTSLTVGILGLTLGVGGLMCVTKANDGIRQTMAQKVPYLHTVLPSPERMWHQPELGLLAGEILTAEEDQLHVVDFEGTIWNVLPDEETVVVPAVELQEKEKVKVIGNNEAACCNFKAKEIRPWECKDKAGCENKKSKRKYKKESSSKKEKKEQDDKKKPVSSEPSAEKKENGSTQREEKEDDDEATSLRKQFDNDDREARKIEKEDKKD